MKGVKTMKKKLALLAATMMLTSLAACSEQAPASEQATDTASGISESTESTEPVTIHFFNAIIENVDWYEDVIDRFEAEHPNIKVEMEFQKDYDAALKVKFQTGDVHEIINGGSSQIYIDQGRFLDLSDMDRWWDRMLPGMKEVCTDYKTGKQFFITTNTSGFGLLYNKDIYEELNLTPAKTYDEFISNLNRIKQAYPDTAPLYVGSKDAWMLGQMMDVWGYSPIRQKNGNVETKRAMIENDQSVLGFAEEGSAPQLFADAILDMQAQGLFNSDFLTATYDNALDAFANGRAANLMQGLWAISLIQEKNPDFDGIGFAPLPSLVDGGQPVMLNAPDVKYFIGAESEHPEEAKIFLDYLFSPGLQKEFTELRQCPSAFSDVEADWGAMKDDVESALQDSLIVDWSDSPIGFAPDDIGRMIQDLYSGRYASSQEFAAAYASTFESCWAATYQ